MPIYEDDRLSREDLLDLRKKMPEIGEIRKASELGYKSHGIKYVWQACPRCGKERWVQYVKRDINKLCFDCANKNRRIHFVLVKNNKGYWMVRLPEDDFFYSMTDKRRFVTEHRLVMAKHIGRCLHSWEIVHHKNHVRTDNRIENLQLVSDDRHKQITILEGRIRILEERVTLLEAENTLLRSGKDAILP